MNRVPAGLVVHLLHQEADARGDDRYRISAATLRKWVQRGHISSGKPDGYDLQEILAYLEHRQKPNNSSERPEHVKRYAVLVEWQLPDDTEFTIAARPMIDALHELTPYPPANVTAFPPSDADRVIDVVFSSWEWGYSYYDSPTAVVEALDEADARREVERDKATVLKRRKVSRTSVGEWEEVPSDS